MSNDVEPRENTVSCFGRNIRAPLPETMAAFHYHPQIDAESNDDDTQVSAISVSRTNYWQYDHQIHPNMVSDETKIWQHPWPKVIGITQIISGIITSLLGITEIVIIPLQENGDGQIYIGKKNCYGIGVLAGLLLVITGSTAIRASFSQRLTTVSRFLNLTFFTLTLYTAFTIFLIIGYTKGWTKKTSYEKNSSMFGVHIFLTLSCILGFLFTLAAFLQYFNQIFFGELQLFKRWMHMCCPNLMHRFDKKQKTVIPDGQNSNDPI